VLRRKGHEIEFDVPRYVFAYYTGLSICVRIWKNTPVFKIKGKYQSGKTAGTSLSHTGQMINERF